MNSLYNRLLDKNIKKEEERRKNDEELSRIR